MTEGFFWLYRVFDAQDRLLYVGQTRDPKVRFSHHNSQSKWFPDACRTTTELFGSRDLVRKAEILAITTESPLHNVAGTPDHKMRVSQGMARGAAKGRKAGRPRRSKVTEAAIRRVIHLGTAEAAAKLRISKAWYIELRRRMEDQNG